MRSLKKGPFLDRSLIRLATQVNIGIQNAANGDTSGSDNITKTWKRQIWSRRSVILPEFVGLNFQIHNGMKFIPITVTEDMIGHRFGEFSTTRKLTVHKEKAKK